MRLTATASLCLMLCCSAAVPVAAAPTTVPPPASPASAGGTAAAGGEAPAASAAAAPSPADARLQEAIALASKSKFKEAIAKLEVLRRDPACPPRALSLLGILYVKDHRPKEAMAVLQPLAAAPNAEPAVLYNAGLAALAEHDLPHAQGYFTRAVVLQPKSPASRELGLLYAHEGHVVEAYSLLRPWSLLDPADGEARLTAATLALQLARPAEAEQLIAGMDANDPAIALMHGKILVQQGDGKGAVAVLAPLMARHPPGMELELRRSLAEAQLLAGQPAAAVELLKGHVGNHPVVALVLARAQHKAGDILGALVTLRPFADQLPADAKGLGDPRPPTGIAVEYGRLLVDAGRSPEAVTVLEKATHILPQSQEAWQSLSQAYGAAGRRSDSQAAAAKAEELAKAAQAPPAAPSQPPGS
ncbi:MAG TPA: tetratricopeptide repeat protein [Thermoanaerobaculia bacterium]|jgi:predicted Zn-dependent protease|nr:tetratricopeptide repeat protein [Thermoanaerobaculia bacterium]